MNFKQNQFFLKIKEICQNKKGSLISKEYISATSKIEIQCEFGHIWKAQARAILQNTWCPFCSSNRKIDIFYLKNKAKEYNGELISEKYKNNKEKLQWKCFQGHTFNKSFIEIQKGFWCLECKKANKLEMFRKIAQERGGVCLSESYQGIEIKYNFKCSKEHVFFINGRNFLNGSWCSECSTNLAENICRKYFEFIFEKPFPKIRPNWLINETGYLLELDGFCEELGIAFEHNGLYHYQIDGKLTKNITELNYRKKIDMLKVKLCQENNVKLIIIPSLFKILSLKNFEQFLWQNFNNQNINFIKKEFNINDYF